LVTGAADALTFAEKVNSFFHDMSGISPPPSPSPGPPPVAPSQAGPPQAQPVAQPVPAAVPNAASLAGGSTAERIKAKVAAAKDADLSESDYSYTEEEYTPKEDGKSSDKAKGTSVAAFKETIASWRQPETVGTREQQSLRQAAARHGVFGTSATASSSASTARIPKQLDKEKPEAARQPDKEKQKPIAKQIVQETSGNASAVSSSAGASPEPISQAETPQKKTWAARSNGGAWQQQEWQQQLQQIWL